MILIRAAEREGGKVNHETDKRDKRAGPSWIFRYIRVSKGKKRGFLKKRGGKDAFEISGGVETRAI